MIPIILSSGESITSGNILLDIFIFIIFVLICILICIKPNNKRKGDNNE